MNQENIQNGVNPSGIIPSSGLTESQLLFPEHNKLRVIQPFSQAIGDFCYWLQENNMGIVDNVGVAQTDINQLLARHFQIDINKLNAEKKVMIDKLAEMNKND